TLDARVAAVAATVQRLLERLQQDAPPSARPPSREPPQRGGSAHAVDRVDAHAGDKQAIRDSPEPGAPARRGPPRARSRLSSVPVVSPPCTARRASPGDLR